MGLLGQVYVWETIISILLILTSFYYIFREPFVQTGREAFNEIILSKDFLMAIDSLNLTHFAFSSSDNFENVRKGLNMPEFYVSFFSTSNLIKSSIIVASNCSQSEIDKLSSWFDRITLNKREISLIFIQSNLDNIPSYADLVLICGYKNLSYYESKLITFLEKGKGIVGFFDIPQNLDESTKKLFGIDSIQASISGNLVEINIPTSVIQKNYYPYKYFFGVPLRIYANNRNVTTNNPIGNFSFRNYSVTFEINTTGKEVYFYTQQRLTVKERQEFSLYGYKFLLAYIDNQSISISFRKVYNFTRFLEGNLIPILIDENESKIFLYQGYYDYRKIPVSVLNSDKVAWVSNFDRNNNATDDQKLVLLALILTVADMNYNYGTLSKRHFLVPFIDVENYDFFEPYSVRFGFSSIY